MHYQHLLDIELAQQSLEHLTVARAVRYLTHVFESGGCEILIADDLASPIEVATDPIMAGCLASRVRIRFWGGPPGDRGFYKGTILTMLIDQLFQCVATADTKKVEKFLEVLNGSGRNKARETTAHIIGCA